MMTNGTKTNYEGGHKKELEVIYEYVEPPGKKNRTLCIVLTVLVVVLVIGAGVGVALWQIGLFSSDAQVPESTSDSLSNEILTTEKVTQATTIAQVRGNEKDPIADTSILLSETKFPISSSEPSIYEPLETTQLLLSTTTSSWKTNLGSESTLSITEITTKTTSATTSQKTTTSTTTSTTTETTISTSKTPIKVTFLSTSTTTTTITTSTSVHTSTTTTTSATTTTTAKLTTTTTKTTTNDVDTSISAFLDPLIPTTPTYLHATENSLIQKPRRPRKKKKQDKLLLLTGGISDMKNDQEVGEVIGRRKKKKGCQSLEHWSPHFNKFIGTVFLPAIEAIVSCGYTHIFERFEDYPVTGCFIYYKYWSEWQRYNVINEIGFYEGAFFPWHDKLVLFGGNAVYEKNLHTLTRSITVFQFSGVTKLYDSYDSNEDNYSDYYGSGHTFGDDEDDSEGSGHDGQERPKVFMVDDADHLLNEYGPGVAEACAVSLIEKENSVSFIVTGGRNSKGKTLKKTLRAHMKMKGNLPVLGRPHDYLPSMNTARKQHGCVKAVVNGLEVMVVAGGSDNRDSPVFEVEFLSLRLVTGWQFLGELKTPRYGFPTVGEVLGQLVVVGGLNFTLPKQANNNAQNYLNIDSSNDLGPHTVAKSMEIFDERLQNFRSVVAADDIGKTHISITRYNYYGVMFPKSWCNNLL